MNEPNRLRITALDLAYQYSIGRETTPEEVIKTADLFFRFLNEVDQ